MKIFNTRTQQVEEAKMEVDHNNEIVATFADDTVVKFPARLSKQEFDKLIEAHKVHNEGQEIITPEMEAEAQKQRAASLALIGVKTDASDETKSD